MATVLPDNYLQLRPAGRPHTTAAGRFALPVRALLGDTDLGVFEIVYDGDAAESLEIQLREHLSGRGAFPQVERRSKADLL